MEWEGLFEDLYENSKVNLSTSVGANIFRHVFSRVLGKAITLTTFESKLALLNFSNTGITLANASRDPSSRDNHRKSLTLVKMCR